MDNLLDKIIIAAVAVGALHLTMWVVKKIMPKFPWQRKKPSKTEKAAASATTWILTKSSELFKKSKLLFFVIFTIVLVMLVVLSIQLLNKVNKFNCLSPTSFKNEPTGFRNISFRTSQEEFLRIYHGAKRPVGDVPKDLTIYFLENERFWDWNNIVIRFIFFKDKLYSVAIDYTPLASGPDFDTKEADQAADALMLSRAKEHYGTPEIGEREGIRFYIWRGRCGGVVLSQYNNSLLLIDSQLMLEYQVAARNHGPE